MVDFDSVITQVIPRETMLEAQAHNVKAHSWENYVNEKDEGFKPSGPERPTVDMLPLKRPESYNLSSHETTQRLEKIY